MNLSSAGIQSSELSQFFRKYKTNQTEKCVLCKNVLKSETSETSLRCGYGYYQLAPVERKAVRMESYFVVAEDESCYNWRNETVSVLKEKLSNSPTKSVFK